jgi:glycosyltransferase involved in cell wall biosynthesis
MTPKVSVLICTYNAEKYISATLRSVLVQTFSDFELLILDNNSKDKTVDIIKQNKDPRIHLYPSDKNL